MASEDESAQDEGGNSMASFEEALQKVRDAAKVEHDVLRDAIDNHIYFSDQVIANAIQLDSLQSNTAIELLNKLIDSADESGGETATPDPLPQAAV